MRGEKPTPDSIRYRLFRAASALILSTAIAVGFICCGEDTVEPELTGVMGTVSPLGIAAAVKIIQNDVVVASMDVDSEGNYTISDLVEGEYDLVILADGYESYSQPIHVIEEQVTDMEEITLEKVKKLPGVTVIVGKVADSETGEPIADALVEYEEDGAKTFTYTRKDGSFGISVKADLTTNVTISKSGYESSTISTTSVDAVEISLTRIPGAVLTGPVGLSVGDIAPDFTLPKLGGGAMSLHDTRGKVVLIDFWATWCGPCKAAIPHVQRLYEKYKSKGFVVLGVDVWERDGVDVVKRFKDQYGLTYDILLDTDRAVPDLYQVRGIPSVWILDRNGVITWTHRGFGQGGEVEMEKQILAALSSGPLPREEVPVVSPRPDTAFHSDRDGNFEIYVMNADGANQKRLTNHPAEDSHPSWSPAAR